MSTSTQPLTGGKHAAAPATREQTRDRAQDGPSRPGKRMLIVPEAESGKASAGDTGTASVTVLPAPATRPRSRRLPGRNRKEAAADPVGSPVTNPGTNPVAAAGAAPTKPRRAGVRSKDRAPDTTSAPEPAPEAAPVPTRKRVASAGHTTTSRGRRSRSAGQRRRVTTPAQLTAPDRHYRFVAPHGFRTFLCALLAVAIGVAVVGSVLALLTNSRGALTLAAAAASGAAALYGGIGVTRPQVISLTGSMVEIQRGASIQSFDLVDPAVEIRVRDGEIAFMFYDGDWTTVRSREVNWKVFSNVVMYYQNHADRKAEERVDRFLR